MPLTALLDDGVQVALGADDPLLFGQRLTAQYEIARQAQRLDDRRGEGNGQAESPARARRQLRPWDGHEKVTIDLTKLNSVSGPERDLLRRFLSMIQVQRQDFNGRMITIRAEDLRAIACLFGVTPDAMSRRLDELGLRVTS